MNRSRRELLTAAGAAAAAGAIAWAPLPRVRAGEAKGVPPRRALRLAHVTDVHVQPELGAAEGLAACLRHVQAQKDPPQLILAGGDAVMDVSGADRDRAKVQADLWHRVWKAECSLPVEHCIGNHDVWGWDKKESKTSGAEPGWGKRWALDLFGLDRPYRSFDRAGIRDIGIHGPEMHHDTLTAAMDLADWPTLETMNRSCGRSTWHRDRRDLLHKQHHRVMRLQNANL